MQRSSGILMPVSALPSPYGIGTLGKAAIEFTDFLSEAKQSYWQILPVGPTSVGDSPYQSPSAFAGNPNYIDLDLLIQDGLLSKKEISSCEWGEDPSKIRYDLLFQNRQKVLRIAAGRGFERDEKEVRAFEEKNAAWLPDYSLFMALKKHFGMKSWLEWPDEEIRLRKSSVVEKYRKNLEEDIRFFNYVQYLFFKQWRELKAYVHQKGIKIIGDMALYVAMDSADVWASPQNFLLDEKNMPLYISGVPPDQFTAEGQLWGNPIYNYEQMEKDGYSWWTERIRGAASLYDVIRIDHFRGLESYWIIQPDETTARNGKWCKGPGMSLVGTIKDRFPDTRFIAEDLGYQTPEVLQLLKSSGFPGMKVLQFSFDSRDAESTLPNDYEKHCVCYAGTHDNNTLKGWIKSAKIEDVQSAVQYFGLNEKEGLVRGLLRGCLSTPADLAIIQMQDWLELGEEARMNAPGTLQGNWQWRCQKEQIGPDLAERIAEMTTHYGRSK